MWSLFLKINFIIQIYSVSNIFSAYSRHQKLTAFKAIWTFRPILWILRICTRCQIPALLVPVVLLLYMITNRPLACLTTLGQRNQLFLVVIPWIRSCKGKLILTKHSLNLENPLVHHGGPEYFTGYPHRKSLLWFAIPELQIDLQTVSYSTDRLVWISNFEKLFASQSGGLTVPRKYQKFE